MYLITPSPAGAVALNLQTVTVNQLAAYQSKYQKWKNTKHLNTIAFYPSSWAAKSSASS